jgi:predicted lysophospholipase L1 biosynthesis ABC-type transport system permease subunit
MLGIVAALSGALLGWLAQLGLFRLLHACCPANCPRRPAPALAGSAPGWWHWPASPCRHWPPWAACRLAGAAPRPAHSASTWMVYGAALLALGLIMWRLSLDLLLTFALLGGGLIAALLLGGLLLLGLRSLRQLLAGAPLPGAWGWASCCVIRWRPAGPGLRPDPAGHGPGRPAARRTARHLAKQVAQGCAQLFRPEHPAG